MKTSRNYDPKIRARALELLAAGKTVKEVVAAVHATDGVVRYWHSVYKGKGNGANVKPDRRVADALTFLRHARTSMNAPASKLSRAELLALLALDSLEGN